MIVRAARRAMWEKAALHMACFFRPCTAGIVADSPDFAGGPHSSANPAQHKDVDKWRSYVDNYMRMWISFVDIAGYLV